MSGEVTLEATSPTRNDDDGVGVSAVAEYLQVQGWPAVGEIYNRQPVLGVSATISSEWSP